MSRYLDEAKWLDEQGWSRWVQPLEDGYKMACCDCGLVHTMRFRVEDGRAQFQVKRNNRATGQVRRHKMDSAGGTLILHRSSLRARAEGRSDDD